MRYVIRRGEGKLFDGILETKYNVVRNLCRHVGHDDGRYQSLRTTIRPTQEMFVVVPSLWVKHDPVCVVQILCLIDRIGKRGFINSTARAISHGVVSNSAPGMPVA